MPLPLIPVKAGLIAAGGAGLIGGWGVRDIADPVIDPPRGAEGVIPNISFLVIAVAVLGIVFIFLRRSKIL